MNGELTCGPLKKALIFFALPLFLSQLFQTLYNTADTVIIGYTLGSTSLAAVGSVAALFELIVGFCTGFSQGLAIIGAQKFGAGDLKGFRRALALSIVLSILVSMTISILFLFGMESVLRLLQTPPELFDQARKYISVITLGLIITMLYNLAAAFLRAAGDSKTPLVILLISSVINIALDFQFIVQFHMGVAGTAWATLCAQLISLILCVIWVIWKKPDLSVHFSDFRFRSSMLSNLLKMGFSMALMSSIVSCGTLILQTGINPMGTQIIAGHTAARKLISILNLPVSSLMMALSSFAAQNVGAGEYERAEQGIAFSNRLGLYYGITLTVLIFLSSRTLVQAISGSTDPAVLDIGSLYLNTNIPFFFILAILLNLRTSLQSMSMTLIPILSSVIELAGKMLFTFLVVPFTGYYGICAVEPFVWTVMGLFLSYFYLRNRLFKSHGITAHIYR